MSGLVWLMGIIVTATLMGDAASPPAYPQKPVLAAEMAPHVMDTWDDQWITAARRQFESRRMPTRRSPMALMLFIGLGLIIWRQCRQELRREGRVQARSAKNGTETPFIPGVGVCYGLASRWGLR